MELIEKKKQTQKSWEYFDTNQRGLCQVKSVALPSEKEAKDVRDTGNEADLDHSKE